MDSEDEENGAGIGSWDVTPDPDPELDSIRENLLSLRTKQGEKEIKVKKAAKLEHDVKSVAKTLGLPSLPLPKEGKLKVPGRRERDGAPNPFTNLNDTMTEEKNSTLEVWQTLEYRKRVAELNFGAFTDNARSKMKLLKNSSDPTLKIPHETTKFRRIEYDPVKCCGILVLEHPEYLELVKSIVRTIRTEHQGVITHSSCLSWTTT